MASLHSKLQKLKNPLKRFTKNSSGLPKSLNNTTKMLSRHISFLKNLTKASKVFPIVEVKWNAKTNRIKSSSSNKTHHKRRNIALAQYTISTVFIIAQGIKDFYFNPTNKNTSVDNIFYMFEVIMYGIGWMFLLSHATFLHSTCAYINSVLDFADLYEGLGTKAPRQLNAMNAQKEKFTYNTVPITFAIPLLYAFVYWRNPCITPVPGHWLLPECHEMELNYFANLALKLSLTVYNVYVWWLGTYADKFAICVLLLLCLISVREYLDL